MTPQAACAAVLFDLDGTLLDTLRDLADSMNAVLEEAGFPTHAMNAYRHFVGDGMATLVERSLPPEAREPGLVPRLVEAMRHEYSRRWLDHSRPYHGVLELLEELIRRGMTLAILSNKPHPATEFMVRRLLPWDRFALVLGARDQVPVKPHPAGALEVARTLGLPPRRFLYLGDTNTDMKTAVAADMHPVGVLWGFRDTAELLASGARDLIAHPLELLPLLDR